MTVKAGPVRRPAIHLEVYKIALETATVAVLLYIAYVDLRTFSISNASVLLLLLLYILYAPFFRSVSEIASNTVLAILVFGASFYFFLRNRIGGGDVKFLAIACLWVQSSCTLLFAVALLVFVTLHLLTVRLAVRRTFGVTSGGRLAYAPSIAGALIGMILFGCV